MSQETLAEMIGTTRSRVSTFMNKFRKLGFIEYNGTWRSITPFSMSSCTTIPGFGARKNKASDVFHREHSRPFYTF